MESNENPDEMLQRWAEEAMLLETEAQNLTHPGTIPMDRAMAFVDTFAKEKDLSPNEALYVLTCLFQRGGTTKSCNPEESILFKDKRISVKTIRTVLSKSGLRNKSRQVARTLSPYILQIALKHKIAGNLAKSIGRRHDIKESDKPYLSDYFLPELQKKEYQCLIDEHLQFRRRKT